MMCRPHSARFSTRGPMPSGCTSEAQHVDGRCEELRCGAGGQHVGGGVRSHEPSAGARDHRRVRHMPCEDPVEGVADRAQRIVVEPGLGEHGGVAGGEQ